MPHKSRTDVKDQGIYCITIFFPNLLGFLSVGTFCSMKWAAQGMVAAEVCDCPSLQHYAFMGEIS